MELFSAIQVSAVIKEGSWFVLYAVISPAGARCDLETKTIPMLTVTLNMDDFAPLGQFAFTAAQPKRDQPLYLTSICYLTLTVDQREELFRAFEHVKAKINLDDKEQPYA